MHGFYRLKELVLFDFFYSLSSLKSLIFLIPYFLFWYLVLTNISEGAIEWLQSGKGLFVASWLLGDQKLALQLFVDRSVTLSIYQIISLSVMPLFVMLAANNQYSSDASRGAFRFILTRSTRTELFTSRFIATVLLVSSCLFITTLWATALAYMNQEDNPQTLLLFASQTFLILFFYSLPFVSFMSMVSALAKTTIGSLFMGIMLYVFLVILVFTFKNDINLIVYIIPGWIKINLYNIQTGNILFSIVLLTSYMLFYFACGWKIFAARDM